MKLELDWYDNNLAKPKTGNCNRPSIWCAKHTQERKTPKLLHYRTLVNERFQTVKGLIFRRIMNRDFASNPAHLELQLSTCS
ncbi:hypothetical protein ACH5RR_029768 [Cinchona calisaya]|uniref:Transposase n=1 Tax=Cinchona calisaya TaxID=153742 RepID=A0ABD2YVY1_9GENT